jgi:hypothetical protein
MTPETEQLLQDALTFLLREVLPEMLEYCHSANEEQRRTRHEEQRAELLRRKGYYIAPRRGRH